MNNCGSAFLGFADRLARKNQENYTWVINELLNGYFANG